MKLSTIITAYDRHELTQVHVRECMNSSRVPDEIIVVNDGGKDYLKELLQELDIKTTLIYAKIQEDIPWNYTGARNLGYWLSRGDILAMEDNDNIPSRDVYKQVIEFFEQTKEYGRVLSGNRKKVLLEDVLKNSYEEWKILGTKPTHQDTQFLLREVYMTVKGCDERFAGKYAWACADWRRRLDRAGIKTGNITESYTVVIDGETVTCKCVKTNEERGKTIHCPKCGLLHRRKSYRNYGLARERDGHTQSPIGVLNFHYSWEQL